MKMTSNKLFDKVIDILNENVEKQMVTLGDIENHVLDKGYGIIKFNLNNNGNWEGPFIFDLKVDIDEITIMIRYNEKVAMYQYSEYELKSDMDSILKHLRENAIQSVTQINGKKVLIVYK